MKWTRCKHIDKRPTMATAVLAGRATAWSLSLFLFFLSFSPSLLLSFSLSLCLSFYPSFFLLRMYK